MRKTRQERGTDLLQLSSKVTPEEAQILAQARAILFKLMLKQPGVALNSPQLVREYLTTMLGTQEREFFVMLLLDNRHRVLGTEVLAVGTIDAAAVHPREIVKSALRHNAAAVCLIHNHPSMILEPSQADEVITRRCKEALELVGIKTLDHFIVGGGQTLSFSERGLL